MCNVAHPIFLTPPDLLTMAENLHDNVTPLFAYTDNHPRWCILDLPEVSRNPSATHHLHRIQQIQF